MEKHTCVEMSRGSTWHKYECGKPAKYFEIKWGKQQWFCKMHAPSERKRRQAERDEARRANEAPALAKRIAENRVRDAAPLMLEALRYVVGHGFLQEGGDDGSALSRCRAAIAKAEGR